MLSVVLRDLIKERVQQQNKLDVQITKQKQTRRMRLQS